MNRGAAKVKMTARFVVVNIICLSSAEDEKRQPPIKMADFQDDR